jgi:carbon monoxide dehydrogenase subunit G
MEMSGEYRVEAPIERVWDALNDPEILKQAIPGCDEIQRLSDTELSAKVTARVGPVKASFTGQVTLSDLDPPNSYRISGEGKGGAVGFAKGGANVSLEADGDATILKYEVDATVGGKLAQLGARLIDGTAKKMAGEFFSNFAEVVGGPAPEGVAAPAAAPAAGAVTGPVIGVGTWIGGLIIAAAVLIALIAG